MATKETWPFFALGFVFACVSEFTLIALGVIGVVIAIVYLGLKDALLKIMVEDRILVLVIH